MVIRSGLGLIIGLAGGLGLVLANLLTDHLTSDKTYYASHPLPKVGGAFAAGLLSFAAMTALERSNKGRTLIDKATGQEVVLRRKDSLFFIPAKYLPYVIFAVGLVAAFFAD